MSVMSGLRLIFQNIWHFLKPHSPVHPALALGPNRNRSLRTNWKPPRHIGRLLIWKARVYRHITATEYGLLIEITADGLDTRS